MVVLTIAHNLSRYIEMPEKKKNEFKYDFAIVPVSAGVLFGLSIGLPGLIKLVVQLIGDKPSSVPFMHGFGMYCYSLSSFLIASLICGAFSAEWFQWILMIYSGVTSLMFIITTYYADLS